MSEFFKKHHRSVFYFSWFFIGCIQAFFTELWDDEAYYWVYSRYLDWGYFDHPPMTGLLVKLGYAIFPNELGVRFFPLLLNTLSLVIIERLTEKKHPYLFYAIALSIAAIQVAGFLAVPDIPLIFFTALFFLQYKRFIHQQSFVNSIFLALSAALLFYCKYHAALIILFTLLSNIKLFTNYRIYIVGLLTLLFITPHLIWQYNHDWVSFRYHLFESNVNRYKVSYTTEYILGQLLLPGPLAGFILIPAALIYKPKNLTEKALKFNLIGIYIFFLLSSFRGRVEGNWTSPIFVSLIVLSHQFLLERIGWKRALYKVVPITLAIVLFARVIMIFDILPAKFVKERFHAWNGWPKQLKQQTNSLPIVFIDSYQKPSKYWFYSGEKSFSLNSYARRKNNYNFWPIEDSLLGKPVFVALNFHPVKSGDSLKNGHQLKALYYDSSFVSFSKLHFSIEEKEHTIKEGENIRMTATLQLNDHYKNFSLNYQNLKDSIRIAVYGSKGFIHMVPTQLSLKQLAVNNKANLDFNPLVPKGSYFLRMTISSGNYVPTINSDKINLKIE
jgi:hypothetical protein